jgi:hypothetical protein
VNERDFLSVHWEVYLPRQHLGQASGPDESLVVRLHVESPRYDEDQPLNNLKRDVIAALLASNIAQTARQIGYGYEVGTRTSAGQIQQNKSTEAFRVLIGKQERKQTEQKDIEAVHAALGSSVDEVLNAFGARLHAHFPSA